ncbi:MAG: CusA/CzcA family heavy metal efflux RND transporter [Sandaracinaceae bacterium]|nr:CusA/CzcA family heavy metal efflux RND transporter [Sandaracinaceae bacterium]
MIGRIVHLAIVKRWVALILFVLLGAFGWMSWQELSIEAYPDIADTSAQVITQWPGHAAEEVEQQITIPLERALNGTPGLEVMRSRSTFGLSIVTLVFQDGIDDYFARARINERVAQVEMPPGAAPELDPLTSPIGEIYRYTLVSETYDQRQLRELQRWIVVPGLRQVPGIADVTNFGGETLQYQLVCQPDRLTQYGLTLDDVIAAVEHNSANAGGSILVRGDQGFVVRGIGLVETLEDLGNIVVTEQEGTPVFLHMLGDLRLGGMPRNGILGIDETRDGVSGIVLLLRGQNPSFVLDALHHRVDEINAQLPDDVRVVAYLDRTRLVETTLHTVSHTMIEGIALVLLVLVLFLGSPRSALIVATVIPLSLLIAFIMMRFSSIPANLLSLGAIDFGIIVDGAIVVMESLLAWRERHPETPMSDEDAASAASQVARPVFFAKIIVITAYLPLFAFQRVEKKLFTPMAWTVGFALLAALFLALGLVPGLSLTALRKPRKLWHNPFLGWAERTYDRAISLVLARPWAAIVPGIFAAILAVILGITVGKGFLPELDEGSIWLQVQLPPGLSLERAADIADEVRHAVHEEPQVSYIVTQLGRNDDGTDPWTPSHIESSIGLYPYDTWPAGMTKHDLIDRLDARLHQIPGITYGFSQPMIDGVNDKISGAHADLVVKVFADDLREAREVAGRMVDILRTVPGAADVAIDQEPPLPQLQVVVDRQAAARYGVNVQDVAQLIEVAIGGRAIAEVYSGERRYDVAVRFPESVRDSTDEIGRLTLGTPSGARVPLAQIAHLDLRSGESTITRERGRRHLTVKLNLRGRDLSSFLEEAQRRLGQEASIPEHYDVVWGGQFENQQRAARRLGMILPGILALIFLILYAAFGKARLAALILVNVPLAMLGGMLALHAREMTLNVSSAVGFITLFGVAVQNGVILLSRIEQLRAEGLELDEAVRRGTVDRLRAVMLTATVAGLGMLPAAMAHGIGSDVQRPLATVIVGGLFTATALTLFVLPALYVVIERWVLRRSPPATPASVLSEMRELQGVSMPPPALPSLKAPAPSTPSSSTMGPDASSGGAP